MRYLGNPKAALIGLMVAACVVGASGAYAASDETQSFVSDVEYASPPMAMEFSKEIFIGTGDIYVLEMLENEDDRNHPYDPALVADEKYIGDGGATAAIGGTAFELVQIMAGYTGKNSEVGWLRYR